VLAAADAQIHSPCLPAEARARATADALQIVKAMVCERRTRRGQQSQIFRYNLDRALCTHRRPSLEREVVETPTSAARLVSEDGNVTADRATAEDRRIADWSPILLPCARKRDRRADEARMLRLLTSRRRLSLL